MTDYLSVPIEIDQQDVLQAAYDFIQSLYPNWVPADGNLDVAILQAISTDAASLRELASSVPDTIFRWYGATIIGIPPIDAVAASSTVTFIAVDNAGYTIPAGTQISVPAAGDTDVLFETLTDAVIPPGSTTVVGVPIQATEPGSDGTDLGSIGSTVTLIDALTFVTTVTLNNPTAGGSDAEDDDTYLNRLVKELRLLSPRLIIPSDFAANALSIPGVVRTLAIDGYNPADQTYNNPRMITIVGIDATGNPVDGATKTAIQTSSEALREVNFIVNVMDPNYTNIDVTFDVAALDGFDTTALAAAVVAAIRAWLDPSTWGVAPLTTDPSSWNDTQVVRYLDLASLIHSVGGVDHIKTLTFAKHGLSQGTADVALTAPASLTTAGTITGTAE